MKILDPRQPDPFEPFISIQRNLRWWQGFCAALLVLLAATLVWGMLMASRPPIVIVKDRAHGEPASVSVALGTPPITTADARTFFLQMSRLRFGWDSLTVQRDMAEFRKQCYRDHRELEERHLDEIVEGEGGEKVTRLMWWVKNGIRNTLALPGSLDSIECKETEEMFHCHMQVSMVTQHLMPAPDEKPVVQRMIVVGTLLRVPHRIETPYGLVVGALRQLPADGTKAGQG